MSRLIVSAIVAMSENRVIGRANQLPWRIPGDLKRFKNITLGHPVIMGRKTFESIGRVLPQRTNLIITRKPNYHVEGAHVLSSLEEALRFCEGESEVFIIGGGEIYQLAMSRVNRIYLTLVHQEIEGDTFFPPFSADEFHEIERESGTGPIPHSFITLERT